MQIQNLTRQFRYNGAKLADPSPAFSLQQVRDFYANTYPEIVNAEIEGPELQATCRSTRSAAPLAPKAAPACSRKTSAA